MVFTNSRQIHILSNQNFKQLVMPHEMSYQIVATVRIVSTAIFSFVTIENIFYLEAQK